MKPACKSRGKSGTHRATTSTSSLSSAIGAVAHKENRHHNARPHSSRSAITETIVSSSSEQATPDTPSSSVLKWAYQARELILSDELLGTLAKNSVSPTALTDRILSICTEALLQPDTASKLSQAQQNLKIA